MKIKSILGKLRSVPKIAVFVFGVGLLVILLSYRLGVNVDGLSQSEVDLKNSSQSLRQIANAPQNAPYKLVVRGLNEAGQASARNIRGISAIFGLMSVVFIFYTIKTWHSRRTATIISLLFASSAWFLHHARIGIPLILLLAGVCGLIAFGSWLRVNRRPNLAIILGSLLTIFALYTPGLIWFILAAIVWKKKVVLAYIKRAQNFIIVISILLVAASFAPFVWALIQQPSITDNVLGLNQLLHLNVKETLLNIARIPSQLFYRGPKDPTLWLERLPLLDIFVVTMAVIGGYTYLTEPKRVKVQLLGGIALISLPLIAVNGMTYLILLMPIIYLLAANGIEIMLKQWFSVFPVNPFARITAISLISLAVIMTAAYHITHYFTAWPNAPETRQTFNIKS